LPAEAYHGRICTRQRVLCFAFQELILSIILRWHFEEVYFLGTNSSPMEGTLTCEQREAPCRGRDDS
jgi:hypothetical protein